MLISRAALLGGAVVDIRVDATISEVAEALPPLPGEDVLDARGCLVIPGLHDHHVHLRAAAAAAVSVRLGPPQVRDRAGFAEVLADATPDGDGWIRAVGYHDSVAGPLDRALLDSVSPAVPARVQHRSGAMWILNSAGLARVGMADHPDGRLFRADADWLRTLPSLDTLSRQLTRWGVTGVTDATPDQSAEEIESFSAAIRSGQLRQRLHCMAPPETAAPPGVTVGAAKVILDDSRLDLDELERWVRDCHNRDSAVAVHSVTDSQLVVTIAALRAAGARPGDRIEHAAMVPQDCLDDLVALGVTVVTQPNFVAERGDEYLAEIPAADQDRLWRVASLLRAGIPVALSTDMPFGHGDPWAAMRAAVRRRTPDGVVLGADECITAPMTLTMFFGRPDQPARARTIDAGQPGDLCVLSAPEAEVLDTLDAGLVAATVIGGRRVDP